MKDWRMIRERYLRDEPPVRLGGLAANLARISSFSDNRRHKMPVVGLIVESQHFIEWTVPAVELELQERLVGLQIELARWRTRLDREWEDESVRLEVAAQAKYWSQVVLKMSGLVPTT
jgi:hypothetical protein